MGADDLKLKFARAFADGVPHNRALGMQILEMAQGTALFELPYDLKLVGNPDTGVIHGGPITALLDGASGAAVFAALTELVPIATLDLRIDYLRPAEVNRSVLARATCYKMTKNVAFTRAVAYHDDPENPIAHSVGTFMVSTRGGPKS
ncbi:MAG TPA: PaaI family thioesterase [Polyangiaceae bacterium]|nr:PaaI family thioesterase [Polyangiaceae bacterium]